MKLLEIGSGVGIRMEIEWVLPPYIFAVIVTLYTFFIILLCYYLRKYLKSKKNEFIAKRHPYISCIEVVSIILTIAINFSIITFYRCIEENTALYQYLWNIAIFSQPITLYAALYSLLWRCWHFYYEAMLNKHIDSVWESVITHKALNNWYSDHKPTLGSPKYIGKIIFIMYSISCIISICIWLMHHIIEYVTSLWIEFAMFSVPYILFSVLYYKAPKEKQNALQIHHEMKRINTIITVSLITYLTIIVTGVVMDQYQHIFIIALVFSTAFYLFIASLTHTKWVLSHMDNWTNNSLESLSKTEFNLYGGAAAISSHYDFLNKVKSTLNTVNSSIMELRCENDPNILHKHNVKDVLQNHQTFNLFVKYLNTEYSIECILAFVEMVQFQHYVLNNYNQSGMEFKDENELFLIVEFRDFVPRSHIVYVEKDNGLQLDLIGIRHKGYDLYNKYIATGSQYEVNINFQLRNQFRNNMYNYDKWINENDMELQTLVVMFNQVSVEMYQLLSFSLSRFKSLLKNDEWDPKNHKIQIEFLDLTSTE